jgi:hypothetical protein
MPPHVCRVMGVVGGIKRQGAWVIKAIIGGVLKSYFARVDWRGTQGLIARGVGGGALTCETARAKIHVSESVRSQGG